MSVPAHTHNDPHAHIVGYIGYNYETYIEEACPDAASCAWCSDVTECGSPTVTSSRYELFFHMAEKADDYDSENKEGEVDGGQIQPCFLWPDLRDGCYQNIGNVLIPEAIRHVAGLYQLFWADKSVRTFTACQTDLTTIGGDAIVGEISLTDCTSTKHGNGWYADYYTFTGSVGDRISISITASFGENIVLYDPNGTKVQDEHYGRIRYGSGWYTLGVTGTYILEVTSQGAGETGSYTLTSVKQSAKVNGMCGTKTAITMGREPTTTQGNLAIDDCVSFKYGINWYADYYTFTGSVGDRISISITASFGENIVLYDPNGTKVQDGHYGRISYGSGWYTLGVTGTYILEVTSQGAGETGSYTLTSVKQSAKVNGMCGTKTAITMGREPTTTQGNLAIDDCVSFKYGINWYADYYTFTGSVGDRISISITASFGEISFCMIQMERKFRTNTTVVYHTEAGGTRLV